MRSRSNFTLELSKALSDFERGTLSINKVSETVDRLVKQVEETLVESSLVIDKDIKELNKISSNLREFIESFRPIAEELSNISSEYDRLFVSLNHMNRYLVSIEEIASHTELVAINASIEASRAGEGGKTFAVVAKEIGDMAKRTFKLINGIKEVEKEIEPVLKEIRKSVKAVNEIRERMDKLVEDIDKVVFISKELNDINRAQSGVILELKGLSGVSAALRKVFSILSLGKRRLASTFNSIFKLYHSQGGS